MKVRRNARLAAVQVIFQYYFSKSDINKIIRDFSKFNEDFLKKNTIATIKNYLKK